MRHLIKMSIGSWRQLGLDYRTKGQTGTVDL